MRAQSVLYSRAVTLGVFVCMLLVGPATARVDDVDDLVKRIVRETRDSAGAAKELVASAKGMPDAAAVQTRLCEKAYEYGIAAPAGYDSALAALDLLAKVAPARTAAWDDKRLDVYRLGYLRGDRKDKFANGTTYVEMLLVRADQHEKNRKWSDAAKMYSLAYSVAGRLKLKAAPTILARLQYATFMLAAHRRVAALTAAIKSNPDDLTSRNRLVETYLIDLDLPAEASRHLSAKLAPTLRTNVSLAAREASGLTDGNFLTLGNWYRSLAAKVAVKMARARVLARARDNLKMFLEVYPKKDIKRLDVERTLKLVEDELKRLGADPGQRPTAGRTGYLHPVPKGAVLAMTFEPKTVFEQASVRYVRDLSGNSFHGKLSGGKLVDGIAGKGIYLDGDDYLTIAKHQLLQGDSNGVLTASVWYYVPPGKGGGTLISKEWDWKNADYRLSGGPEGLSYFTCLNSVKRYTQKGKVPIGHRWTHAAFVLNRPTQSLKLYCDGKLIRNLEFHHGTKLVKNMGVPSNGPATANRANVYIGRHFEHVAGKGSYFTGTIDELVVYRRVLSDTEILSLYKRGSRGLGLR